MGRRDGKLLDSVFCEFAKKMKDGEEGWKTVGVAVGWKFSWLLYGYLDCINSMAP
jgi:hypothetical protein